MLNLINTAVLYEDLTRDGEFSERDMIKVGYGLGYSFNLLIGVFVEAPWAVVRAAQPVTIGGMNISILERSASYWTARENTLWGNAVRGFRVGMVAMGAFGVLAASLELEDIFVDYKAANTSIEKNTIAVKILAVGLMDMGAGLQIMAGLFPATQFATLVLNPWFTIALMIIGIAYLFAAMVLNHLKQDSVGWWLRKCCWSTSKAHLYPPTPEGRAEEKRSLLKVQLSPIIFVKSTYSYRDHWVGKDDYVPVAEQNGAWVQIRFASALRGNSVSFAVSSIEKPWGIMSLEKSEASITQQFLDNGKFINTENLTKVKNERPVKTHNELDFPLMPPHTEDIIWQTWVPLSKDAKYLELQLWYPSNIISPKNEEVGYLFQAPIDAQGNTASDKLPDTLLVVQSLNHEGSSALEIA